MRSLRTLLVAAGLVGIAPAFARAQNLPAPETLLEKFQPSLKGVDYEVLTNPQAISKCKVRNVTNAQNKVIGYELLDEKGKLLRRLLNTAGSIQLDQWSYYLDGFEVYRESDTNDDQRLDECRWMNAGGTRIAKVASVKVGDAWKLKIVGWKQISAEEASKVFVQGLVSGDRELIETVLATPDELKALGVPQSLLDKVAEASGKRIEQVKALQAGLKGWTSQTVWQRLDGVTMPHLIPKGPENTLTADLVLYENCLIQAGPPNGLTNPTETAFLQAAEIVKIGDTWKFVGLPHAIDIRKPLLAEAGIRNAIFEQVPANVPGGGEDPKFEAALSALAKYDEKTPAGNDKKELAEFHVGRIRLLNEVLKSIKNPDDQLTYNKSVVDSLASALQTGLYPKAEEVLDSLIKKGDKLSSYAAFRKIYAVFFAKSEDGGNLVANQKQWMGEIKGFIAKYPEADEVPEALFQLGSINEFNVEEEEARKFYGQLARDFPATDQGKKAAGALKRLELEGKPMALKGPGLNKETIDLAQYRGKAVLVLFWLSADERFQRDLPELVKIYERNREKGFEIVGVNLDSESKDLEQFLKDKPLPWPEIVEGGGMEKNRLALEFGIITLPTMILVDGQGKVVNRNIRSVSDLDKQLEKVVGSKGAGVAFGTK